METWLSGLKHLTANEASCYRDRRFESFRLRSYKIPPLGGYFVERRRVSAEMHLREGFEAVIPYF